MFRSPWPLLLWKTWLGLFIQCRYHSARVVRFLAHHISQSIRKIKLPVTCVIMPANYRCCTINCRSFIPFVFIHGRPRNRGHYVCVSRLQIGLIRFAWFMLDFDNVLFSFFRTFSQLCSNPIGESQRPDLAFHDRYENFTVRCGAEPVNSIQSCIQCQAEGSKTATYPCSKIQFIQFHSVTFSCEWLLNSEHV